jgi:hypothetical protein
LQLWFLLLLQSNPNSRRCVLLLLVVHAGDFTIASDRLRRYIAIGSGLATARAHKVRQQQQLQQQ